MVGIIVVNVGKTIINHWPSRKSPYRPFSNEWLISLFYPQDRIYNNQAKLRNYHQKEIFNQVMKGCSDGCGSCLGIANQFQGESMGRTIKLAYFMCVCVFAWKWGVCPRNACFIGYMRCWWCDSPIYTENTSVGIWPDMFCTKTMFPCR